MYLARGVLGGGGSFLSIFKYSLKHKYRNGNLCFPIKGVLLIIQIIVMVALWPTSHCSLQRVCPSGWVSDSKRGLCGPDLASAISNVCNLFGGYYGLAKRSVPDQDDISVERLDDEDDEGIFVTKKSALSYLRPRRSSEVTAFDRNIVCECCVNACDLSEMREYCRGSNLVKSTKRSDDDDVARDVQRSSLTKRGDTDELFIPLWIYPDSINAPGKRVTTAPGRDEGKRGALRPMRGSSMAQMGWRPLRATNPRELALKVFLARVVPKVEKQLIE